MDMFGCEIYLKAQNKERAIKKIQAQPYFDFVWWVTNTEQGLYFIRSIIKELDKKAALKAKEHLEKYGI